MTGTGRPGPHLVVHAHPVRESFGRALFTAVLDTLDDLGAEVRSIDLYGEGFDPVLSLEEHRSHLAPAADKPAIADHVDALRWAEHLVLVYPTWWSGVPAILKGWFDRVWVNDVAFVLPDGSHTPRGGLGNICSITVVTTHGSSKLRNLAQGQSGRRMILRGLRSLCGLRCRSNWIAMYDLDRATQRDREEFVERVRGELTEQFAGGRFRLGRLAPR